MASATGLIPGGSSHGIPHAGTPHPEQLSATALSGPPSNHSNQEPFVFAEDFEDMDVSGTGAPCVLDSCDSSVSHNVNTTLTSNMDVLASAALNNSTSLRHPGSTCDRSALHLNGTGPMNPLQPSMPLRGSSVQGFPLATTLTTSSRLPMSTHQLAQPAFNFNNSISRPIGPINPYHYGSNVPRGPTLKKVPLPTPLAPTHPSCDPRR